jgi:alpha-pyrone synthase
VFVDGLLHKQSLSRADVDFWAVHPGGRRIIENSALGLQLSQQQTADSWYVLNNYGNMLSPSVMFVLERILKRNKEALRHGEEGLNVGVAFSFSPGVGVEGILLRRVN